MRRWFSRAFTIIELLVVIMILAILAAIVLGGIGGCSRQNPSAGNGYGVSRAFITVQEKWVKRDGSADRYLISTQELGVMMSEQDPWKGKMESSDTYARLQPGRTYEVEWTGWRNTWGKQYPNILKVLREVPPSELRQREEEQRRN